MEEWLIIQSFIHGLNMPAQNHIDAASGGLIPFARRQHSESTGREDCFQPELER
jgi:hypothetical protein